MRRMLLFTMCMVCLVFSLNAVTVDKNSSGDIIVENDYLKVVLNNPNDDLGCRFTKGAWLKNIYLKGGCETGMLINKTIFPNHMAFGFTEEMFPANRLRMRVDGIPTFFKIGVGVVKRPKESRFSDMPVTIFPWSVEIDRTKKSMQSVVYTQKARNMEGFNYTLRKIVTVDDNAIIKLVDILENTGEKRLTTQVYTHPFFATGGEPKDCWYTVPLKGETPMEYSAITLSQDMMTVEGFCEKARWLAGGNRKTGEVIGIMSDSEFAKVDIWKSKTCYALEPFINIDLAPGEKQTWQWILKPGKGLGKVTQMSQDGMISIKRDKDLVELKYLPIRIMNNFKIALKVFGVGGDLVKEYSQECSLASPVKPAIAKFQIELPKTKFTLSAHIEE